MWFLAGNYSEDKSSISTNLRKKREDYVWSLYLGKQQLDWSLWKFTVGQLAIASPFKICILGD
jgi:hypothetical protein